LYRTKTKKKGPKHKKRIPGVSEDISDKENLDDTIISGEGELKNINSEAPDENLIEEGTEGKSKKRRVKQELASNKRIKVRHSFRNFIKNKDEHVHRYAVRGEKR
jgi:hypothetical protein